MRCFNIDRLEYLFPELLNTTTAHLLYGTIVDIKVAFMSHGGGKDVLHA